MTCPLVLADLSYLHLTSHDRDPPDSFVPFEVTVTAMDDPMIPITSMTPMTSVTSVTPMTSMTWVTSVTHLLVAGLAARVGAGGESQVGLCVAGGGRFGAQ